ncbi:addiction module toxin protein, zeta toxin-like protein [Psychroflexus torquis ATCC 700755]|uniref:Addiction module toxin protein, zeta toxin-like protein n=1 Tax=Psychroflexus torquis (strain ATCC 700755 / CIP 106069 / ACAM 623) TaxID=313595 RepID=K4IHX1_PSYTT|nr:zeta toxin family protein [Psychroflexus torquis]AFU69949.1 addiction module toxin protein, zeta toxin-like protein [Psychroflexus torquis ATCC 700755]
MPNKRLRMFAGPNGSGKTTVFNEIKIEYDLDLGIYLNADEIEKKLKKKNSISISDFNLSAEVGSKFNDFISSHTLFRKAENDGYKIDLTFEDGLILNHNSRTHSYEASILTDFLRQELIKSGQKLSFETVMSHPSKIETLKFSKQKNYKNYLYFISTESVEINKSRVIERVLNGGHPVPPIKIEERYYRSLEMLQDAIKSTYRTFIFDNSESKSRLILDIHKAKTVTYQSDRIPNWVDKYCLGIK